MTTPGRGFARRVTSTNIAEFAALLRQQGQSSAEEEDGSQATPALAVTPATIDPLRQAAEAKFVGTHFKTSVPFTHRKTGASKGGTANKSAGAPTGGARAAGGAAPAKPVAGTVPSSPTTSAGGAAKPLGRGPLLWRKILSATDAQSQVGNPTGDLRLVQAKFLVSGKRIDQTTYFRSVVFAGGPWKGTGGSPYTEQAAFDFDFTILGVSYGVHRLTVSHKPSGVAGQGNYTTGLRWGSVIGKAPVNVTARTLSLYGPPPGKTSPFFIDIA